MREFKNSVKEIGGDEDHDDVTPPPAAEPRERETINPT